MRESSLDTRRDSHEDRRPHCAGTGHHRRAELGKRGAFQLRLRGLSVRRADRRRQPHHLYAGGHRGTVVHHPAVPRGWDGEHINTEKDRLSAVFFCVYRLVIIMDKTCCGAVQVENGFPFWAAAAEKIRPCQSMVPYCFLICCTFSFVLQPLCR